MVVMHYETCEAPLCAEDREPELADVRIWYPGEPVCGKRPYTRWQKAQRRINRRVEKGTFKYTQMYFTRPMLDGMKVYNATKGLDPDKPKEQQLLTKRYGVRYGI